MVFAYFFSSRRRHTRFDCDWSSDVCSSDLASLPHILIRYYTVKDQASARKSTVIGIASIGFFYVLTLYLGLGAMTSGALDPTDNNMSAPLLAKSFNNLLFAVISAIAFTTVLGTVSGLIMAGSGAVAHDLIENFFKVRMDD